MLIDFHTHLLPAIDDGSQSVAESLDMLDSLRLQNVHCVVATPHFYSNKTSLTEFINRRDRAYESLCAQRPDLAPKVLLGAELTFFRGIGKADNIERLCITGTNTLLIELPFSQWGQTEITAINRMLDRGITPIIAHVERYFSYQRDMTAFNTIINLPVYLQVNAEALLSRKTRKFVFTLIENEFPVLLGTDCHNMKRRKPNLEEGRNILMREFGQAYLDHTDALGAELLNLK